MDISLIAKLKNFETFLNNYKEGDENQKFNGKSLLFYALSNGDLDSRYDITNFLLDKGADPKVINENHESLLHILLSRTNHDLERTISLCYRLVDAGVDLNQFDDKKRVALQYLINMKYSDEELEPIYKIWFNQPVLFVNTQNEWGKSPIQIAEQMPYRKGVLERMKKYVSES